MRISVFSASMALASTCALAQPPPCPQLRIVVPFSAGGATDFAARVIVDPLGSAFNKSIVIENRAGATGNIGTAIVAKSAPDGCTFVMNTAAILTYQWAFSSLGYDASKDLSPVGGIGRSPSLISTGADSKATDLASLVRLSNGNPDGLRAHHSRPTFPQARSRGCRSSTRVPALCCSPVLAPRRPR